MANRFEGFNPAQQAFEEENKKKEADLIRQVDLNPEVAGVVASELTAKKGSGDKLDSLHGQALEENTERDQRSFDHLLSPAQQKLTENREKMVDGLKDQGFEGHVYKGTGRSRHSDKSSGVWSMDAKHIRGEIRKKGESEGEKIELGSEEMSHFLPMREYEGYVIKSEPGERDPRFPDMEIINTTATEIEPGKAKKMYKNLEGVAIDGLEEHRLLNETDDEGISQKMDEIRKKLQKL